MTVTASDAVFKREDGPEGPADGHRDIVGEGLASPERSCPIRLMNWDGVSPAGSRVHCTSRNLSGTCSSSSVVSSITTGTRKALCDVIR
jgi:hypothetical protein